MLAMLLDETLRARIRRSLDAWDVRLARHGSHRAAAVALTLVEEGTGAEVPGLVRPQGWSRVAAVLLTRRADTLNNHAGQWALPGGRIDEGESPIDAALREMEEEVGLRLSASDLLGSLDDYVTRSGFVITPLVFWGGEAPALVPNADEVASVHRIALEEFLRADAPLLDPSEDAGRQILRMPVGESWIAAPTAALLYQFREVCIAGRPTRVDHFDQPLFARR
ncbi:MAG: coenzyme pyrophosphatase [Ramlibacter sp.]|jgi:8-oxo-dGTP pyrophosphatase MutT (NUDIX family)|nr:coenzyme pyrophosphatase [Ramlibacter sp.]